MSTSKALKNSAISIVSQIINIVLTFVTRKIFVIFLDIEYLGYQSLFSNIFNLISLTELGIGNVLSFHLYKEFAQNNTIGIAKLMKIYKLFYKAIAFVVSILGVCSWFFLPHIMKDTSLNQNYIDTIYFLQLVSIILGYCLAYRRQLYIANQKEYKCVQYDLISSITVQILQILTLAIFKNYLLYLTLQLTTTLIANIVIWNKTNKEYSYINESCVVTKQDIKEYNLFSDIKNFVIHKFCYIIWGGTDNIIISSFCGIRYVALYGNYTSIQSSVFNLVLYKLLNPIQATIGNIIYSGRPIKDLWQQFCVLDMACWYLGCYISLGYIIFYQPTIELWLGSQYLLDYSFVIAYAATAYFITTWEIIYKYRSVFGDFKQDRNCMILSAILNIVLSILLVQYYGILGVQIGTIIAFMPIIYGRIRFVIQNYFHESLMNYYIKHLSFMLIFFFQAFIAWKITYQLPIDVYNLFVRVSIWLFLPLIINSLFCHNTNSFKGICNYTKEVNHLICQFANFNSSKKDDINNKNDKR